VPQVSADALVAALREAGVAAAECIGRVLARGEGALRIL
jgi:hypothetical protein